MIRFACLADVHIGRHSSAAPGETALAAFDRVVDRVIAGDADGLLIAGDLFDSRAAQYPARRGVLDALQRLAHNHIPVVAVAGNHDPEALRDFHRSFPGHLQLLGDRDWETTEIKGVRIVGRSFEKPHARNLLEDIPTLPGNQPTVALLHADINATSPYNPVRLEELRGRSVGAWVLGHVHLPRLWENPLAAYIGSPQALDPGEPGLHGFRWLTWDSANFRFSEPVPVSSVRYETLTLTSTHGQSVETCLEEFLAEKDWDAPHLFLRIHLRIRDERPHIPEGPVIEENMTWQVISTEDCPAVDLLAEAEQTDARGQAARLLLALESPDPAAPHPLIVQLLADLEDLRTKLRIPPGEHFDLLRGDPASDHAAALRAIRAALNRVLSSGRRSA